LIVSNTGHELTVLFFRNDFAKGVFDVGTKKNGKEAKKCTNDYDHLVNQILAYIIVKS